MHEEFIERFTQRAAQHAAVLAAWLAGSFGRGNADRYADVDAHLLIAPERKSAFQEEVEPWLAAIRPLVLFRTMFDGGMINAMTVDGLRLDVWMHAGEQMALGGEAVRVLYDKGDYLDLTTSAHAAPDTTERVAALERQMVEFWRMIAMLPTVLGRNERIVAFQGLGFELGPLNEVLIARAGRTRETGIKRLNTFVSDESRRALEDALRVDELTLPALARAHLRLAALMRRVGPAVAATHGFVYPHELEQTVVRYVSDELRRLGLADCLTVLDEEGQ